MSAQLTKPYQRLHQLVYRWSGGRLGKHGVGCVPTLLLTSIGRRSGLERTTALVYAHDGASFVVVASNGGSDVPPNWLANVRAQPRVSIHVGTTRLDVVARVAIGPERERLWELVNRNNRGLAPLVHPGVRGRYDVYQRHTDRQIAVVVLDPA